MSSHVPSPTSSPASAVQDSSLLSQESIFRSSQTSNPDSSSLSLESSFQLDTSYTSQYEESQKHPKGKRKRTTTQDKAILEAAYNANPKPDKAARLDLVKRVSLNEKEVQIWFQNRRQNDRRKSRPLSPQEIAQLRFGGSLHMLSSDNPSFSAAEAIDAVEATRSADVAQHSPLPAYAASQEWPRGSLGDIVAAAESSRQDRRHSEPGSTRLSLPSSQNDRVASEGSALSQSLPGRVGYLSNRWHTNEPFSAPSSVERSRHEPLRLESLIGTGNSEANDSPRSTLSQSLPRPSKPSSQFRISLSLEGKAEIVDSLQSPPREIQSSSMISATLPPVRAPRILQRSKSALAGITLPPISALTANLPPQLPRGRSRDVSAWESCCDADTRDELTKLAENESSGSAVAAISLLRSSSQTSSLANLVHGHMPGHGNAPKPSSAKRNATPLGRRDLNNKKPKLARSSSSVARLQSIANAAALERPQRAFDEYEPANKYGKASLVEVLSPSGDSDKENWSPGKDANSMGRRRPLPRITAEAMSTINKGTNPRRPGPRLLDHSISMGSPKRMFLGGRSNTAPAPRLRGGKGSERSLVIFEDGGSDAAENDESEDEGGSAKKSRRSNDEVERFMRGEVSPSKKGDVDCVAGLLALSQGNWR
ncbi:hypothetical protein PFICI_01897 [Pestalotiopsis fici W106-1]|uniref:Homeobox domain-containing protein n=1 Tax=Pestalotiopsis fici (strain W106-1 / CGMCC3.15140) TaxID=1229662 RepID=W3XQ01_PESFW|nr:uncharacterized protein PFICI_01897 [Pestalotiopsis fici W106-1]ETS88069.1 hypothetical protein PFICI_01897 [Pestalotiopsis fici W106-1]